MALLNSKPMQSPSDAEAASSQPGSYISALKQFSAQVQSCAPQNRMIERLRRCSDMELQKIGIERSDIERTVYRRNLA